MYCPYYHYPILSFLSLLDKEPLKTHMYIVTLKERKAIKTLSCEKFSVSENSGVWITSFCLVIEEKKIWFYVSAEEAGVGVFQGRLLIMEQSYILNWISVQTLQEQFADVDGIPKKRFLQWLTSPKPSQKKENVSFLNFTYAFSLIKRLIYPWWHLKNKFFNKVASQQRWKYKQVLDRPTGRARVWRILYFFL